MNSTSRMESLRKHWSEALDATEPELAIDRSRARFLRQFADRAPRRTRSRIGLALAMAAMVAGMVALFVAWPRSGPNQDGPRPGERVVHQQALDFADGSRVLVHDGSQVHLHSVDPQGARVELERGVLSASIVHREDTNWTFISGPFTVVVTGTKLSIDWQPSTERFEVSVEEGSVRVTGPMLQGGRTVAAGQACRVHVPEARLEVTPTASAADDEAESSSVAFDDLRPAPSAAPSQQASATGADVGGPTWLELEQAARWDEAMAAAEREGLASIYASGSSDQLLALARAARISSRADVATHALLTCRERFPGTPAAAQAAFLLGRSAAPASAAAWFAQYLQEAPGGPFAREAAGRLIESHSQAGNDAAARQAAKIYLKRYPNGPHAAFAQSIIVASRDD
jgi:transmembrane sensor